MTKTSKPEFPTTTAHTIRLCLFQPTRRPQPLRGAQVSTPWGTVKVWGRIGQQHADVLEAICFEREKKGVLEDGRIKLLVDPAKIRRRAGQVSGSTFAQVLKELEQVVIEIVNPTKLACSGHLIDHIDNAVTSDGTPITRYDPLTGGERPLRRVELGKAFCKLVSGDIWIGYDPAAIATLQPGISQAVARHVLSHKAGQVKTVDGVLTAVCGEMSSTEIRHRRRELRSDTDALLSVGVVIDGDRIQRTG